MDNVLSLITNELSKAGQDAQELQLLERLELRRITPDKEIPPMQFLFQMFCKPCFPRGELVAVAGKAKSGKTFVSSILMTLCFREEVLTVRRMVEEQLRVLWFDTEQSEESTQDILNHRILPMLSEKVYGSSEKVYGSKFMVNGVSSDQESINHKPSSINPQQESINHEPSARLEETLARARTINPFPEEMFHIFNVRADFWQERLPLLEAAMHKFKPDLVILDGIRDLVSDINDGVMAQDVIERLMHLASDQHCCLVCILHQNKGAEDKNLRGWIGTELKNKAFEVYECTKDADRIFTWSQTDTRKYDIVDKLKYTVGEDGIPQLCSVEQLLENARPLREGQGGSLEDRPAFNPKYLLGYDGKFPQLNIEALFTDAFRPGEEKSAAALQATIMSMANITSYKFYNRRREEAVAQGVIEQGRNAEGHIIYSCPSKPAISYENDNVNGNHPRQMELFNNFRSTNHKPLTINPDDSPDEPPF